MLFEGFFIQEDGRCVLPFEGTKSYFDGGDES